MSRDEDDKSARLFDVRTIERNIRKGLASRKDYDKYLKGLPDVTDKIAPPDAPRSVSALDDDGPDIDDDDDTDQFDVADVSEGAVGGGGQAAAAAADEGADDELDDDELDDDEDDDDDDTDTDLGGGGGVKPTPA